MQASALQGTRLAVGKASLPRTTSTRAARAATPIRCSTLWQLQPDSKWCSKPENSKISKQLSQVDLTGAIGRKRLCSIASHDYQSEEAIDMCVLEHGGIHLIFEAEGTSNPLDSPSVLWVTDVDSSCTVLLDGKQLEKGQRQRVKPGAVLALGSEAQYQVQRNVFAHA